jgi:nucleotide-binding universal stress UspA family protein
VLEKILVPLDESDLSHRILSVVRRLVRTNPRAEIHLVRVLTRDEAVPGTKDDPVALARAHLDHAVELLARVGLRASSSLQIGDPASEILKAAEAFGPSLIALASHGHSGVTRWIRGSTAERVLAGARHPVLVANPIGLPTEQWWGADAPSAELARATELQKILVPLDGSEAAAAILPLVRDIAQAHDSEVTLLLVRGDPEPPSLEPFARRLKGVSVKTRIVHGDPASAILGATVDGGFDLVAMTTHGHTSVSRWAFGSVAEHVLRHCATPLLVKRTAGFPERTPAAPRAHAAVLPTE